MGASVRPEPDNWLLEEIRRQVQPASTQKGPQSPFAPADASAVRTAPRPATLADYAHAARQTAAGVAGGVADLPAGIYGMLKPFLFDPGQNELVTVGRGEVRTRPAPQRDPVPLKDRLDAILHAPVQPITDAVGGGAAQNVSDQSFRDLGYGAGNLAAWEASARGLPKLLASLRGTEEVAAPASSKIVKHYGPTPFLSAAEAHPLELPPEGLSFEERQAWRRRAVNRRMGRPEGTGEARGYANASGQEMFDDHLRRLGLGKYVDRTRGGLLDLSEP